MKITCLIRLLVPLLFAVALRAGAATPFVHPGILHSREELDFVRQQIEAGAEPWKSAWAELRASSAASLDYRPRPRTEVVRGAYNNPNIGSSDFSNDAVAAYTHALQWCLTGEAAHARKTVEILDAWSSTLAKVSGHDTKLLIGMNGVQFCIAAELMRHTYDGWAAAGQERFAAMLRTVFYPPIADFHPRANGNWDASMIQTMLAMGIYLDDRAMFDRAAEYFRSGRGNGAVTHYFNAFGECQESGRDQGHTQMGLGFLGCAAEIAWKQGVDLYGTADNRLALGFEYTAKYNLGHDVPYEPYTSFEGVYKNPEISAKGRGEFSPIYERLVQHYHRRLGLDMPYSREAATREKNPRRGGAHVPWGRLMFAGLPTPSGRELGASASQPAFKIYPAPKSIELSVDFAVTVEGESVPVYKAKVPPAGPIPRLAGTQGQFGFASYASLDIRSRVTVSVVVPGPVQTVKVLPTSAGIVPRVAGQNISFSVDKPQHLTIEVNGDWHASLHLFVNPFEEQAPQPGEPNVVYFGPGLHEVSGLMVGDNTTVYVAGGAVVRCVKQPDETPVEVRGIKRAPPSFMLRGKNITLRGRGIIEGGTIVRREDRRYMIVVQDAQDVTIEGVILHDPSHWTVPINSSDRVHVDNIKIIGRRGNSDGVDISNSRDILVENCFMRTLDDLVVVKSFAGRGEVRNVRLRKCVLWNELAHALSIGAELHENVTGVLFEDCDVIHDVGRETALRIYHCDDALVSDVTFQNIRVEEARRLISLWIGKTRWSKSAERGHIRHVTFRNITATSAPIDPTLTGFQDGTDWKPYVIKDHASMEIIGFDPGHQIKDVRFDQVVLDGKKIDASQLTTNGFVEEVRFQ